jgi:putative PIN family toxin of toxin-antitoxin system
MNIVLDTNCLLVAMPQQSPHHRLWRAFRNGAFVLCYTTEILQEYNEILAHFYSPAFADMIIGELLRSDNTQQIVVFYKWRLIEVDPDDNKFVDCAISTNARYIVSNDKHFNVLKTVDFPKVEVLDIETFKKIIKE